jgi:hypothetical protein
MEVLDVHCLLKFSGLQIALVAELERRHPHFREGFLLSLPECGVVLTDSGEWKFRRHGLGVVFVRASDDLTIDAHRFYPDLASPIDAWRLRSFLESIHKREFEVATVQESIERLVRDGMLRESNHPKVYEVV